MEALALPFVAAGVTKIVDLIRNLTTRWATPAWLWNVTAFGVSLLGAFALNVELVSIPEGMVRFKLSDTALRLLTGLVIGGLSSGWHELFDLWSSRAKSAKTPIT